MKNIRKPGDKMEKAEIRKKMLAQRHALTSKYINDNSDLIFDLLTGLREIRDAKNVLIYSHFNNEVKTGKLAGWLLFNKKRVFLPVVDGDVLLVADMSSTCFELNTYGVAQPERETACFVRPDEIDLVIVPGLAFDEAGNRIGFGKGYYDDLLAQAVNATKIALAYDFQMTDGIHPEKHDIRMDMVATPKKIYGRTGV